MEFVLIEKVLKDRLGLVARSNNPEQVASAVLRDGGVAVPYTKIPESVAMWLIELGLILNEAYGDPTPEKVSEAVAEATKRVRRHDAPFLLGLMYPDVVVPECQAKQLSYRCRQLLGQNLERTAVAILKTWHNRIEGTFRRGHWPEDVDDDPADEIPNDEDETYSDLDPRREYPD